MLPDNCVSKEHEEILVHQSHVGMEKVSSPLILPTASGGKMYRALADITKIHIQDTSPEAEVSTPSLWF